MGVYLDFLNQTKGGGISHSSRECRREGLYLLPKPRQGQNGQGAGKRGYYCDNHCLNQKDGVLNLIHEYNNWQNQVGQGYLLPKPTRRNG